MKGSDLINEPFDFSQKNRLSLESLHSIVMSIMFPESMPKHQHLISQMMTMNSCVNTCPCDLVSL